MISVMLQLLRIIVETFLEFVIVIVDALRILVIVMSRYVYAKTEETRRAMEARAELEDSERTRAGGRREGHLDAEFDEIVESDEMLAPRPAEEASRESATRSLAAMTQNLSETWQGTRRSLDESREKFSGWASRLRTNFARGLQETVDTLKSDMSRATQALRITPEEAAPPSLEAAVEEAEKADARKSARSGAKKSSGTSRRTAARATREKQWYED